MAVYQLTVCSSTDSPRARNSFRIHARQPDQSIKSWDVTVTAGVKFDGTVVLPHDGVMESRRIGYVRVSTGEQDTALQVAALRAAGCELIFEEKASGTKADRPALASCLKHLGPGDTLVVWKFDRLGRTTVKLLELIEDLDKRGVHFFCTTQGLDTATPMGKLMMTILAGFAEFERNTIIERTKAGLEVAHSRGHHARRPRVLTGKKLALARELFEHRPISPETGRPMNSDQLAAHLGISKMTLYRYCKHEGLPYGNEPMSKFIARNPDPVQWLIDTDAPMYQRNLAKIHK